MPVPRSLVGKAEPRPRQDTSITYLHYLKGEFLRIEKRESHGLIIGFDRIA